MFQLDTVGIRMRPQQSSQAVRHDTTMANSLGSIVGRPRERLHAIPVSRTQLGRTLI